MSGVAPPLTSSLAFLPLGSAPAPPRPQGFSESSLLSCLVSHPFQSELHTSRRPGDSPRGTEGARPQKELRRARNDTRTEEGSPPHQWTFNRPREPRCIELWFPGPEPPRNLNERRDEMDQVATSFVSAHTSSFGKSPSDEARSDQH